MNLTTISHCAKNLSFEPLQTPHPLQVGYAWNGFQISHFQTQPNLFIELHGALDEILPVVYRKLSLPEFARLFHILNQNHVSFDPEKVLSKYHLKWSQDLSDLFNLLIQQSTEFQTWCSEKDLGLFELKPLLTASKTLDVAAWVSQICKLKPNRHLGSKIIEYIFLDPSKEIWEILETSTTAEIAFQRLYQIRYPVSSQKDQKMSEFVKSFPWPSHIKAQWQREGDRSGIHLDFFNLDPDDFCKKVSQLNELKNKLHSEWINKNGN